MARSSYRTTEAKTATVHRWRIVFVADLHGMLDGFQESDKRVGGLVNLAKRVRVAKLGRHSRRVPADPPRQVIVCFGGDMVRRFSHHLLTEETAEDVWDYLVELLKPDVVVLGNHEVRDFGLGFFEYVATVPAGGSNHSGCTRNIEWHDKQTNGGFRCEARGGQFVPYLSAHTEVGGGRDGKGWRLRFVGLTSSRRGKKMQLGGYRLRTVPETAREVLLTHCFNRNGCSEHCIMIHVAHYNPPFNRETILGDMTYAEAFGIRLARRDPTLWGASAPDDSWHLPTLVLKAHDHAEAKQDVTGKLGASFGPVAMEHLRGDLPKWVPTFSPGMDGQAVGVLDLDLRDGNLGFSWATLSTTGAAAPFRAPTGWWRGWDPPWCVKGQTFHRFGRDEDDPSCLAYAMDLLMRALSQQEPDDEGVPPCAVLIPDRSVMAHAVVPDESAVWHLSDAQAGEFLAAYHEQPWSLRPGQAVRDAAQKAWREKVDWFDIRSVFGDESRKAWCYMVVDASALTRAIRSAIEAPRVYLGPPRPVLPRCPDAGDGITVADDGDPGLALSMWLWIDRKWYVFAKSKSLDAGSRPAGIHLYSIEYRANIGLPRYRFLIKHVAPLSDEALGNIVAFPDTGLRVWTTGFASVKLLGWGDPESAAGKADEQRPRGGTSVPIIVERYLQQTMADPSRAPLILR